MLADLSSVEEIDLGLSGFGEDELGKLLRKLDQRERRERVEDFDLDAALEAAQRAGLQRGGVSNAGQSAEVIGFGGAEAPGPRQPRYVGIVLLLASYIFR